MKRRWLILAILSCALLTQAGEPRQAITKQMLEERIHTLESARVQAIAQVNAISGAIQECQHWLDQLEAAEKTEKEAPK